MAWLGRQELEDREHRWLSPWATLTNASGGRRLDEPPDPMRTVFQRDRDRIVHCTAFRRMQHKTQVLAAFEGDHYRSRMTHSLEVAQLARGTTIALRLNTDLAEAVALAHDLGHPPFGHVGERALDALMADRGGFRHNAQGARIVDYLEDRYGSGFGLNLCRAVRQSLLKGVIPDGFPLSDDLLPRAPLPVEAQIVDLCDKIAYLCHDLDDGLRAGAFALDEVEQLTVWQAAEERAFAATVPRIISEMIALMVHDLIETTAARLAQPRSTGELPPRPAFSGPVTVLVEELQRYLRERFYRADFVLQRMERGKERLCQVFERLIERPEGLPEAAQRRIDTDGLHRTVCDHVAGMTDRYLLRQPT